MIEAKNVADNIALVEQLYAALDADDVPRALELCSDDVEWSYPAVAGLTYGGEWRGRDGVAAFLDAHDRAEEILEFRVDETVAQGDHVAAFGLYRGRAKPDGSIWETRFVHLLTVEAGLIQGFAAYFDTAAALAARDPSAT